MSEESSQQYRGITEVKRGVRFCWKAQLACQGQTYHLGYYPESEEAARAWDNAVYYLAARGYRAKDVLNFPGEWSDSSSPMSERTAAIIADCEARRLEVLQPLRELSPGAEYLMSRFSDLEKFAAALAGLSAGLATTLRELRNRLEGVEGEKEKQRRQAIEMLEKLPADAPQREIFQKILDDLNKVA